MNNKIGALASAMMIFCSLGSSSSVPAASRSVTQEHPGMHTSAIFRKVVCCGDSYTAGYITDSSGKAHPYNEDYSWVHYMSARTSREWVNCGVSGANVITWQTKAGGLEKARLCGKAQAYVVGLGLNDSSKPADKAHYVTLGSEFDIGTKKKTYYAGLSAIIRELHNINPEAVIFVQTIPDSSSKHEKYNKAIRNVCKLYKQSYNVHLLDLYKYQYLYQSSTIRQDAMEGHYTAIGYEQFAENLEYIMSDYINNNVKDFQNVAFIPYESNKERE